MVRDPQVSPPVSKDGRLAAPGNGWNTALRKAANAASSASREPEESATRRTTNHPCGLTATSSRVTPGLSCPGHGGSMGD